MRSLTLIEIREKHKRKGERAGGKAQAHSTTVLLFDDIGVERVHDNTNDSKCAERRLREDYSSEADQQSEACCEKMLA